MAQAVRAESAEGIHKEYTHRLEARRAERDRYARQDRLIGNWRLFVASVGVVMAWLAVTQELFSLWWLLAPAGVFLALALHHEEVIQRRGRAERAVAFYELGLR